MVGTEHNGWRCYSVTHISYLCSWIQALSAFPILKMHTLGGKWWLQQLGQCQSHRRPGLFPAPRQWHSSLWSLSHPISSSLLLCPCLSACQIKAFFKWGKKDSKIFLNWKDDFLFIFQKYSFVGIGTSPSSSPSSLSIFPFHNEKRFLKNYNCYFSN